MDNPKLLELAYESARAELIQRVRLRDHVLLVYLGLVSTILGIAFGTGTNPKVLFVIPFVSCGVSILIYQHNNAVGALGKFCRVELGKFFTLVPQWDASQSLRAYAYTQIYHRFSSHCILMVTPCILSLFMNLEYWDGKFPFILIWWASLIGTFYVFVVTILTQLYRKKLYDLSDWDKNVVIQ